MAQRLYSYRPALDGIRGYLMVAFLLWHVGVLPFLPGLWIAMNLFFILSAFLITRLLLAEHRRFGDISVSGFYVRRVRRLAPALLVMLGAVTLDGLFFAPAVERMNLKGDIVASLFYVMNWRLVLRDDPYFDEFSHPSITRHAWSLSVEEQFYLVIALVLVLVIARLRSRLARTAPFLVLAAVSVLWATTIDLNSLSGQAHAYYGTDVRLQALALGVAIGVWTAHRDAGGTLLRAKDADWMDSGSRLPEILGWVGLGAMIAGFVVVEPLAGWMFSRGGMMLFCLAAAAYIVGCAQRRPTLLVRLHSPRAVVYSGKISYGVYVYHWPIYLWLERYFPEAGHWGLALATLVLAYGAAALSYRFLERPVIKRGWRAFGARGLSLKAAAAAAMAFVVGGSLAITGVSAQAQNTAVPQYVPNIPTLVEGQPEYREPHPAQRIAMFGDSVPYFLVQRMPTKNFPGLDVVNLATPGCDLLDEPMQRGSNAQANDPDCRAGKARFESRLRQTRPQAVVIMGSLLLGIPHDVDGHVLWLDSPEYRQLIDRKLTDLTRQARAAGVAHVIVTTVPCRGQSQMQGPIEFLAGTKDTGRLMKEATHPTQINGILTQWAKQHGVDVVDLAAPVCGTTYQPGVHGKVLYDDGIHFSTEATPMIWGWLAPQILTTIGAR